jgi:hypothetical protein
MSIEQHIDDTTYLQWEDGMYVMLDDLEDDYERALVENSLRDSVYFESFLCMGKEDCLGIFAGDADYWNARGLSDSGIELTRTQALYIATGETTCTK